MIKYVENFIDYEVLDCGDNEKIERFGKYILRRPDPQAIWHPMNFEKYKVNAIYHRSREGGGTWEFIDLPKMWQIKYPLVNADKNMCFNLKPFTFKHTGIFPEQATNWNYIYEFIKKHYIDGTYDGNDEDFQVLNLFAYTGGATLAAGLAGAKVVHVDAAKGMVSWARENADLSGVGTDRVRWIVDDCQKFVLREIKRGHKYSGIIMDPPSYGRGPSGEIWKMEDSIYDFLDLTFKLLNDKNSFLLLNSYTTGLQCATMEYLVGLAARNNNLKGQVASYEIGLKVRSSNLILPEGASTLFRN